MSSLSNLPYGKILDYWYEKLEGKKGRYKFLVTKFIEVFTFKPNTKNYKKEADYTPFSIGQIHNVPMKPKLAIVIPIYAKSTNDLQDLEELFESISNLTYQPDLVILVDDNSPVNYTSPNKFVKIKSKSNNGPAKARNKGIEVALNEEVDIIAFTDSDCILDKDWTKQIVFHFQQYKNSGVVSGNTISKDEHWFGTYHNINGTLNGRRFKNSNRLLYGTTANLAITSSIAKLIRFNENFPNAAGEDIEFCFRVNKKGFEINFNKNMIVYHHYGYTKNLLSSLKKFRVQFKKYSKGEKILLKEIPEYYTYFNETEEIEAS